MKKVWKGAALLRCSAYVLSMTVLLAAGCSQSPDNGGFVGDNDNAGSSGNGNDNGFNSNPEAPPPMPATGRIEGSTGNLLPGEDVWFMINEYMLLSGYGTTAEYIIVGGVDDTASCFVTDPGVNLDFDGQTIDLSASFNDTTEDRTCAVEFIGNAQACATGETPDGMVCEFTGVSGQAYQGNATAESTGAGITRYETCDVQSVRIGVLDEFGIVNVHPLALPFLQQPEDIGAALVLAGRDGQLSESILATGFVDGQTIGCGSQNPTDYTLDLNAGRLVFDVQLPGQNGVESCSVRFDGQAVYCAGIPAAPGTGGNSSELLRFEGQGEWTADNDRGELNAVYLMVGNTDFIRR